MWEGPPGTHYRLSEDGAALYEGDDTATALSGRPAGEYEYVLEADGEVSASCRVVVSPPALSTAAAFFASGAVVFVATVVLIALGRKGRLL